MWLGPWMSDCLGEVSDYGRLKMQCLYVARTVNEWLLWRGVRLWGARPLWKAQCPLRRGVRLREVSVSQGSTCTSPHLLAFFALFFPSLNLNRLFVSWRGKWIWMAANPHPDVAAFMVARYRTRFWAKFPASFAVYPSLSLIQSSHLLLCLPRDLFPGTFPPRTTFSKESCLFMWPKNFNFRL